MRHTKVCGAGHQRRHQGGKTVGSILGTMASILAVGGLLYLSLFVEPTIEEFLDDAPPIEQRDVFFDVAVLGPSEFLVAGQYGKIVRSSDSGETWTLQSVPVSTHLQSIAAWNDARAVAVGNGVTALRSDDGGQTWESGKVPGGEIGDEVITQEEIKLLKVRTFSETRAWAVGEMGLVLRSDDFGRNWQLVDVGEAEAWASWNDIEFHERHGWIVGEFARIRRTSDGGSTWHEITAPVDSSLNAVRFRDTDHGIAVGTSGVILTTTNGGDTWEHHPGVTHEHLFDVHWNGHQWLVVGDNGVLLSSSSEAARWSQLNYHGNGSTWHSALGELADYYVLAGARITKVPKRSVDSEG